MDKMWSPWRSQYIASFAEEKKAGGCIFCAAAAEPMESESSLVVHNGRLTITVLNLYPYNNGHAMVVPRRHLSDFEALTAEEHSEIMERLRATMRALRQCGNPDGFNVGANLGRVAGAGIADHLHFHIVPRWNGDTNFMPVLGEVKVLSQDLLATRTQLMEALARG